MRKKWSTPPLPPWVKGWPVQIFKITINYDPQIMRVLGLSVQISQTILYMTAKLGLRLLCTQSWRGGGLVKMTDRWTDGQTDRQTDALLTYAQACIFLSRLTL